MTYRDNPLRKCIIKALSQPHWKQINGPGCREIPLEDAATDIIYELRQLSECFVKAAENGEPSFTLIGRDPTASIVIGLWMLLREALGGTDDRQIENASLKAETMKLWAIDVCHKEVDVLRALAIFHDL